MATEKEKEAFIGRSGARSTNPKVHNLCQKRLDTATSKSKVLMSMCSIMMCLSSKGSYVRYMLEAMKKAGW